jgi:hypothetical protein
MSCRGRTRQDAEFELPGMVNSVPLQLINYLHPDGY